MMAADMPAGYVMTADANAVAQAVLGASTWAVLALTLDIELFTQAHYRASIEPDANLSPLWKDVFLFHWREESQHAILDELELVEEDARLSTAQRDAAVDDLIALVGAVDGILQAQAAADAGYFVAIAGTAFSDAQQAADPRAGAEGLPLAVHRLRRDGAALPEGAVRAGRRGAGRAHPGRAGAAELRRAATTRRAAADGGLNPTPGPRLGRPGPSPSKGETS